VLDLARAERTLREALDLQRRPVAVAFLDHPPTGVPPLAGAQPSGCSFWRLAAEGRTFFTVAADHVHCPIGSLTHGFALPPDRAEERDATLALMGELGYLRPEEVDALPRLPRAPGAVVYAPLGEAPVGPDVVLVAGRPGRVMLLHEAALRAGVELRAPLLGRPTCMALPLALGGALVASTGCVGNRVYTDLPDDELYVVLPGRDLAAVVDALGPIVAANARLAAYHLARRRALAPGDAA